MESESEGYWGGRGWAKKMNRVQSAGENGDCEEVIKRGLWSGKGRSWP